MRQKIYELETSESERKQAEKTLHGTLTICSYCKKIRDDKGDRNRLEAYISKHSEAHFSMVCAPNVKKDVSRI